MGISVYWTDFAQNELRKIFDYYQENASLKIAKQIAKGIVEKTKKLSYFPEMGNVEPLLNEKEHMFRYILSRSVDVCLFFELLPKMSTI